MIRTASLIVVFALVVPMARAQTGEDLIPGTVSDLWNQSITNVDVEGVSSADTFLVINSSGLVIGDILSAGKVQDAIKGVYTLGLFSDVQIDAAPSRGGVKITIVVTEFPKLRALKITGNHKIKRKKIQENLTLFEGRLASQEAIKNNVEKIKTMYSEKGYLLANVDVKKTAVENEPDKIDLEFVIDEGRRVKVAGIAFDGNRHFSDKKLRGKMSTKQKSFFRTGNFNREKYLDDKDKVVEFYKEHGYIDAVILQDSTWYNTDKTRMFINIGLREGNKYYFGALSWKGNSIFSDDKIRQKVLFRQGKVYNQKKYDNTMMKLYEMYQDEGYWYVQIEEKTIPRGDTLDFNLSITENNPVHIRLVNVEGNTKTREKVIRRELVVKPGTVFKRSVLGRSLRELMILNFFSNVEPGWDVLPNGDIDLKVKVTEKETGQFSIGAGYSQVDKLVATIGLGIPNLFGTGQTASIDLELGGRRNTFSLSYLEPWFLDTPTSVSVDFYIQERQWYDWFNERRNGGDIQVGRRLRWPDNYFRLYTGYRLEQVNYLDITQSYKDANVNNPYSVDKQDWPLTTSSMSLTLLRDSRDLPQFPTKGSVVSLRNELAGTFLAGNWNYYKHIFNAEYYQKLFWKVILMGRARFGAMGGIYHGDADIPYSDRFAPGGVDPDGTIRGYDDGQIGPRDSYGAFLRGRFELIYNVELTIPISEQQVYVLLFADAGNAYLTKRNITPFRGYYRSAGPGFRVLIPLVGIMGFDFGYAFDGPEKHSWKTHFQIGRGF